MTFKHNAMNLSLFELEKENQFCHIFEKEQAESQLLDLLGLPLDVLKEVNLSVDSKAMLKISKYNPTIGLARWGDFGEQLMLKLMEHKISGWEYQKVEGQPRLVNKDKNIQLILMSGESSLGNKNLNITPCYAKGRMTLACIQENPNNYQDSSQLRTWIIYYPSLSHPCYKDSKIPLPLEVVYPIGAEVQINEKGELLVYPNQYTCRIIVKIDNSLPIDYKIQLETEPTQEIHSDDFNIAFK